MIVPRKAVTEVQKLVEDLTQEVRIELSTTKVRFTFGDVVLTVKTHRRHVSRLCPGHSSRQ